MRERAGKQSNKDGVIKGKTTKIYIYQEKKKKRENKSELLHGGKFLRSDQAYMPEKMLELEVFPEQGLCSDQIEFILGKFFL